MFKEIFARPLTAERLFSFARRIPAEIRRFVRQCVFKLQGRTRYRQSIPNETLRTALQGHRQRPDIADHLTSLFFLASLSNAKLMVELGTRGGESTRALLSAAALNEAILLSVDIRDCGSLSLPHAHYWRFVQADDVVFGESGFQQWCLRNSLAPNVDFLFVDTSHEYDHTRREIEVWSPYLSPNGMIVFHDTNMGEGIYGRLDGSVHSGWNNQRGVIRAIEEFLGCSYDENTFFSDYRKGFVVKHDPHSNGLTVLIRQSAHES